GLATAYKLLEKRPTLKIAILEKENDVAQHQTGHNSGVIHAGIYYKPGSLKAQHCISGYHNLIEFCNKYSIPYEICGKVIVATNKKELPRLNELYDRGIQNGLSTIKKITPGQIKEFEPHATGIAGIHVPYTGIIDYSAVSKKIKNVIEEQYDCTFYLNHKVKNIVILSNKIHIITSRGTIESKVGVNTAGLYSDKVAKMTNKSLDVRIIPFRGEYFKLKQEKVECVKNLIYPVPDPKFPFLGVHFTRKINGDIEAGPNAVFAFSREGYKKRDFSLLEASDSVTWPGFLKIIMKYGKKGLEEYYRSYNKSAFANKLRELVPGIKKDDLVPGGSGVRAQACTRDGKLIDDFLVINQKNMIHILNAPSPAATASFAIGNSIATSILENY
ncbi:MAG: L-2-hydroxyglutarate oxidase, partial [Bacteroidota bacterium]